MKVLTLVLAVAVVILVFAYVNRRSGHDQAIQEINQRYERYRDSLRTRFIEFEQVALRAREERDSVINRSEKEIDSINVLRATDKQWYLNQIRLRGKNLKQLEHEADSLYNAAMRHQ